MTHSDSQCLHITRVITLPGEVKCVHCSVIVDDENDLSVEGAVCEALVRAVTKREETDDVKEEKEKE
jgi:hypothetical protein